jgi:two-component system cell cycle response regulator DivK
VTAPFVLVVDDNELNVELVRCLLLADGFEFEAARDAREARERLRQRRPDLILMDIQLPGMDGLELTREIKADAALHDVPVVAFTAYAMQGDEARFRAAGCDAYVAKPIDVAHFCTRLRQLLPPAPA